MKVLRGKVELPDTKSLELEEKEHYRFRELMIRNKDKRLYRSMMKNRKNREREAKRLEMKRKSHDQETKIAKNKMAKNPSAKWNARSAEKKSVDPPIKKLKTDA